MEPVPDDLGSVMHPAGFETFRVLINSVGELIRRKGCVGIRMSKPNFSGVYER